MTFGEFLLVPLSSMFGIRSGMNVTVQSPPEGFIQKLAPLPEGACLTDTSKLGFDVLISFCRKKTELVERLPALSRSMAVMGAIWVVFPSEPSTDSLALTEEFVRVAALETGLTDTKRIMIDPAWIALKLQWKPRSARPEKPQASA